MEAAIITGVFTVIGAIAGAVVTAISERNKKKEQRINSSLDKCANQIKAYFYLEKAYMDAVHELTKEPLQTIQIRMRDKVQEEKGIRPEMTVSEANDILDKLLNG